MRPLKHVIKDGEELVEVAATKSAKKATKAVKKAVKGGKPRGKIPKEVRDRWNRGNAFNKEREPHYTGKGGGNELTLNNGKRVDSYVPNKEIVSRKHTQLGDVKEETGIGYLRELDNKYSPGETLKDTPHARGQIGDAVTQPIRGDKILEVPPQSKAIPKAVLDEADRLGITIRDSNGKSYN
jgi:hypothetical protein